MAESAAFVASIRSGAMPVVACQPALLVMGVIGPLVRNSGDIQMQVGAQVNRSVEVSPHSMAVTQTSPSPWAACAHRR